MAEQTGSGSRGGPHDTDRDAEQGDGVMAEIAAGTGAVLHRYPRPGPVERQVVLRDRRDEQGSQVEVAVLEVDGTLRVTGHDDGARVARFFGAGITSYEWVYVVPADRVGRLVKALGGGDGDDVLALLAAYYEQHGGQLAAVLTNPDVGAEFSNWHR